MAFEEDDLTPHPDDPDEVLFQKLQRAKLARKQAENDLKLLCNRIGLLKTEEQKVSPLPLCLLTMTVHNCSRASHFFVKIGTKKDQRNTQESQ